MTKVDTIRRADYVQPRCRFAYTIVIITIIT